MAIYNLGSINIDHVYHIERFAAPGETIRAHRYAQGVGGKGANQSVAVARAGGSPIHIGAVTANGDEWVIERLAEAGVQTDHIMRLAHVPTGHAVIQVDASAENTIIIVAGANKRLPAEKLTEALRDIGPGDLLLLQNETTYQAEAAAAARKAGAKVVYSAAPFDVEALAEVLPYIDWLLLNEVEAQALERAGLNPLPDMIVTLGAKGAAIRPRDGKEIIVAGLKVEAVDTTGAGDCFAGYFAAGLHEGLGLQECVSRAVAASALKVTRAGAADAIPEIADVRDFMAKFS